MNTQEFIEKSCKKHGDSYNYDHVQYIHSKAKVKIFCKKHQEYFNQIAYQHLAGAGCPKCGTERSIKYSRLNASKKFKKAATSKYGQKYDYSGIVYKNNNTKIKIYCKKHKSWFEQTPKKHLRYTKCIKCVHDVDTKDVYMGKENLKDVFIQQAVSIYENNYNYENVDYFDLKTPVEIRCIFHNAIFIITPEQHLAGKQCYYGHKTNDNILLWQKEMQLINSQLTS